MQCMDCIFWLNIAVLTFYIVHYISCVTQNSYFPTDHFTPKFNSPQNLFENIGISPQNGGKRQYAMFHIAFWAAPLLEASILPKFQVKERMILRPSTLV